MNTSLVILIVKENRRMVVSVAVLLVVCIVCGYLSTNRHGRLAQLQTVWAEKRRLVAVRSQIDALASYRQNNEALKQMMARIPARAEFPRVLGQLMDISSTTGVVLSGMSYKPQKSAIDGMLVYSLNCTAGGDYPALKRFVSELQGMDGLTTVETISLSNTDPFEVRAIMEISLSVYLREEQK